MSGRLVLLRHGQSHANVERRLDTRPPGAALTELGHDQARLFATGWDRPISTVLHSPAVRAVQTADEVARVLGVPGRQVEGVHEVQVGELENRNDDAAHDRFAAVYRQWQLGDLDESMPGGESGRAVLDRYLPAIDAIRTGHLGAGATGDVVLVSHGAAIRLVGAVLAGLDGRFALDHPLPNAQTVVLTPLDGGGWRCERWAQAQPPFYPEDPVRSAAFQGADPMS